MISQQGCKWFLAYLIGFCLTAGYFYNGSCLTGTDPNTGGERSFCTFGMMVAWPLALPINVSLRNITP